MSGPEAEQAPGEATAEAGQVMVDGPDGVAVTMSPEAAEETARRMLDAADKARRQVPEERCARP